MGKEFYRIRKEKREWLGERYFQVSFDSDTVLEVQAAYAKEPRRGRVNCIGIFAISRLSFASNYYSTDYVEPCSRQEFLKQFDNVVRMLRPKS